MDYYYDVLLNFQEKYCMFYEWDKDDEIEYVKKMPVMHIDSKTYLDLLTKIIRVKEDFLNNIIDKTKLKQNNYLKYACLFSDGKNSLALEFNEEGLVINKSSLILDDELNLNEFMYNISLCKLDYEIVMDDEVRMETRQEAKVKKIIRIEIENMYQKKNYSKLKYIYLEWFNELLDDIDKMYKNMLKKLENTLGEKEYKVYELIKLSYNNV